MAVINAPDLVLAMDRAPMTTSQLAHAVGVSLSYMCDITSGRRNLKRNPGLRRRIAVALNVPQHWIEAHQQPPPAAPTTMPGQT